MTNEPNDEMLDDGELDDEGDSDGIALRASSMRWVWVLIGSMAFTTFGVALALGARTGIVANVIGGLLAIGFGYAAIVAIRQLLNPGALVVTGDAIEMLHRGRLTTFALADCGPFLTWRNPSSGTISVVFDYRPDEDNDTNRTNRRVMGGSRSLFENYGVSTDALADILNGVRNGTVDGPNQDDDDVNHDGLDNGTPAP